VFTKLFLVIGVVISVALMIISMETTPQIAGILAGVLLCLFTFLIVDWKLGHRTLESLIPKPTIIKLSNWFFASFVVGTVAGTLLLIFSFLETKSFVLGFASSVIFFGTFILANIALGCENIN